MVLRRITSAGIATALLLSAALPFSAFAQNQEQLESNVQNETEIEIENDADAAKRKAYLKCVVQFLDTRETEHIAAFTAKADRLKKALETHKQDLLDAFQLEDGEDREAALKNVHRALKDEQNKAKKEFMSAMKKIRNDFRAAVQSCAKQHGVSGKDARIKFSDVMEIRSSRQDEHKERRDDASDTGIEHRDEIRAQAKKIKEEGQRRIQELRKSAQQRSNASANGRLNADLSSRLGVQ